jgi:hypothetical protein
VGSVGGVQETRLIGTVERREVRKAIQQKEAAVRPRRVRSPLRRLRRPGPHLPAGMRRSQRSGAKSIGTAGGTRTCGSTRQIRPLDVNIELSVPPPPPGANTM